MEPKRLLETEAGRGERLLRAGLSVPDAPPGAFERALSSVGLALDLPLDAAAEATGSGPSAVAGSAPKLSVLGLSTYVLGGMGGGLLLSALAVAITNPESSRGAPAKPASSVPALSPSVHASSTATSVERPAEITPAASAAAPRAPRSSAPANAVVDSAERSLAGEVKLIDRASAALANGSLSTCSKLLDEYRWRFPGGQLEPEAQLLRVRLERSAGNPERARQLAEELLARSGTGPFAARVRDAAGLSPSPEKSEAGPIKP